MSNESEAAGEPFEIVSVKRTKPPYGFQGADWYHYEIAQGINTIHGYRQGSLSTVTRAVEQIVAQLNERRMGNRGRVHLVTTQKKSSGK